MESTTAPPTSVAKAGVQRLMACRRFADLPELHLASCRHCVVCCWLLRLATSFRRCRAHRFSLSVNCNQELRYPTLLRRSVRIVNECSRPCALALGKGKSFSPCEATAWCLNERPTYLLLLASTSHSIRALEQRFTIRLRQIELSSSRRRIPNLRIR